MNIFCARIIIGYMLKYKEHIFECLSRWCIALTKAEKIRKIQEVLELKNPRESVCRSVKDNGRFENKLWGLHDYGAD